MRLTFYGIKHSKSGMYLPAVPVTQRGGGSHKDPVILKDGFDIRPMMFATRLKASNFLRQWLRGHHYRNDREDVMVTVKPAPHRKKEEMEIVPVYIVLDENFESDT